MQQSMRTSCSVVARFRGNAVDGHVLLQQLDADIGTAASALASSSLCNVFLRRQGQGGRAQER
jgi:hypothetical protein